MNTCRVCDNELIHIINGQFTCLNNDTHKVDLDHDYRLFLGDNKELESEELTVYDPYDNKGYYVCVDYKVSKTYFAVVIHRLFNHRYETNSLFSLDDFDGQKFIDRFKKLLILK